MSTQDRIRLFWSKVIDGEDGCHGCWVWSGAKSRSGHGRFSSDAGQVQAHRYAYELLVGPIPSGMSVLHHCDNPPCVRPSHLFVGTQADNMADMRAKGRAAVGVRHHSAKLTEAQVVLLREEYRTGAFRLADLADRYGVNQSIVSRVVRGEFYSTVGGPISEKYAHGRGQFVAREEAS